LQADSESEGTLNSKTGDGALLPTVARKVPARRILVEVGFLLALLACAAGLLVSPQSEANGNLIVAVSHSGKPGSASALPIT